MKKHLFATLAPVSFSEKIMLAQSPVNPSLSGTYTLEMGTSGNVHTSIPAVTCHHGIKSHGGVLKPCGETTLKNSIPAVVTVDLVIKTTDNPGLIKGSGLVFKSENESDALLALNPVQPYLFVIQIGNNRSCVNPGTQKHNPVLFLVDGRKSAVQIKNRATNVMPDPAKNSGWECILLNSENSKINGLTSFNSKYAIRTFISLN